MVFLPVSWSRCASRRPLCDQVGVEEARSDRAGARERARSTWRSDISPTSLQSTRFFAAAVHAQFACLVRAGIHWRQSAYVDSFLAMGPSVGRRKVAAREIFERYWKRKRIRAQGSVDTPHFLSLPMISRDRTSSHGPMSWTVFRAVVAKNLRS